MTFYKPVLAHLPAASFESAVIDYMMYVAYGTYLCIMKYID